MTFSSLLFLFRFLPIVLLLYILTPKKLKNTCLFLASLVFYAWGEPVYVVIMLFSTVVDYIHGRLVDHALNQKKRFAAKCVVASSMIINLSILGFFKYAGFFVDALNVIPGVNIAFQGLPLPIGISFYTFQTMSYTIDIYRRQAKVQKNIIDFGAYVALFPQLVAGPIVQYKLLDEQLRHHPMTMERFSYGVTRFITGLGKKVLLANSVGAIWDTILAMGAGNLPVATAWMGALAFAFQIYFDFSGYSDMAIGLGAMFGFTFPENFRYPYESKSITEFWRRWHITLGSWFREYVYIPLGGNRCGIKKQIRNIVIVWFLTGFWHGAGWNFIAWGLYFAVFLILEKLVLLRIFEKLPHWVSHVYTCLVLLFGWVIFAVEDLSEMLTYIKVMILGGNGFKDIETMYLLTSNALLFIIIIIACTSFPKKVWQRIQTLLQKNAPSTAVLMTMENVYLIVIFLLSIAYLVDATYNPFLYFRF